MRVALSTSRSNRETSKKLRPSCCIAYGRRSAITDSGSSENLHTSTPAAAASLSELYSTSGRRSNSVVGSLPMKCRPAIWRERIT